MEDRYRNRYGDRYGDRYQGRWEKEKEILRADKVLQVQIVTILISTLVILLLLFQL